MLYSGKPLARFLIWQFDEFSIDRQIKNSPIEFDARVPMTVSIQIAKFKLHQYRWRAILPNLMFAKVIHYTVCINTHLFKVL
jgi:hypothetical protein